MTSRFFGMALLLTWSVGLAGGTAVLAQDVADEWTVLRMGVERAEGLADAERAQMLENLETCGELGMDPDEMRVLFPGGSERGVAHAGMLDLQMRTLALAEDGISPRRLLDKVAEGLRKGLDPTRVAIVAVRMEEALRRAHVFMDDSIAAGVRPHEDLRLQGMLVDGLVIDSWRGLGDEDMRTLIAGAERRMVSDECTALELAAAAETATGMGELGADRQGAVRVCADALGAGYTAEELREMGWSYHAAHEAGAPADAMLEHLAVGVHAGRPWRDMLDEMIGEGWMDMDDVQDHGAMHGSVDDVLEMGPGQHGQPGDDSPGDGHRGDGKGGNEGGGHHGGN